MHGCFVRTHRGRVGLAWRIALAGFALVLVAAARVTGEVRVPLPQILIEAEQAIASQQPADAAELLERVLSRVSAGESLPPGLAWERVQMAATTAFFQTKNFARAQTCAETLIARNPSPLVLAEARMILGLALALQEKFVEALPVFAALEVSAAHRDKARLYRAMAAQQAGQIDVAIQAYTDLLASAPRDADWADAALVLVSLHLQQKNHEEARRGLALLQGQRPLVDNLAGLNALSLQLGDALLADGDAEAALSAYRLASSRELLLRDQAARLAAMTTRIAQVQTQRNATAAEIDAYRRLEARCARARTAVEEIEKADGYDAALYQRVGQAYLDAGAPWEAALAFAEVLTLSTAVSERPRTYLALVRALAEAGRWSKAESTLDAFAKAHPSEPQVLQALYTLVLATQARQETALQLRLLERTEKLAGPDVLREPLWLLHAQCLLTLGRVDEARAKAALALERFPAGSLREDAAYLHALAGMLLGQQERAVTEIGAFLKTYPGSRYETDARYRLAAAHYGMENFEEAARRTIAWLEAEATDHPQRGEVLSLQADAFVGLNRLDEALAGYRQALELPLSDELLGYVLDELTRHYQTRGEATAAVGMWEAFVRERPDHPYVINAAYWIGRLLWREGRQDEAMARVADIARTYLTDPTRDGVERLLGELAGMLARPVKPRLPGEVEDANGVTTRDAERIAALLNPNNDTLSPAARARLLFAQAEVASLRQNDSERADRLECIVREIGVADMSPGILGRVGDHLLAGNRSAKARECFERIVTAFPKSLFADFGYVGLGELALAEGRAAEALRRFDDAIDRAGARSKLREATLGRARALFALERWEEARDVYIAIAANRQWRGEATAESVYTLGEILLRQGGSDHLAQAQAHYQRVYLSYRKYTPWVVRAYVRSASVFARLGRPVEAAATLRELLRDERLAARPEAEGVHATLAEYEAQTAVAAGGRGE